MRNASIYTYTVCMPNYKYHGQVLQVMRGMIQIMTVYQYWNHTSMNQQKCAFGVMCDGMWKNVTTEAMLWLQFSKDVFLTAYAVPVVHCKSLRWFSPIHLYDWLPAGLVQPVIGCSVSCPSIKKATLDFIKTYSVACLLNSEAAFSVSELFSIQSSHSLDYYCILIHSEFVKWYYFQATWLKAFKILCQSFWHDRNYEYFSN